MCGIREREKISHKHLYQLDKSSQALPDKVIIKVAQPKAITKYYKGTSTINRHNRIRANELRMDCNLSTKHWDKRFNLRVLGIICIDLPALTPTFFPTGRPCRQQDDELPRVLWKACRQAH
jgi:hypothetical protein